VAAEIILIVDGLVMRDDGDVIRHMVLRITQSSEHLDRFEALVANRRQTEDTEIAALRSDIAAMQTQLQAMLAMEDAAKVVVDRATLAAVTADIQTNTARIRGMVPDDAEERP
jgi:hypothetical protein